MMTQQYYYQIHTRGVDTIAIWTQYAPTFSVGELSLAAHSADVNSFNQRTLEVSQAAVALGLTRASRDSTTNTAKDICSRALALIIGSLPVAHPLIREARRIYRLHGESQERVNRRCLDLVAVWQQTNTFRAAQNPVQAPIMVDLVDVSSFQSTLGNLAQLITETSKKQSTVNDKKNTLREMSQRVDRNNKRWYKSWYGQFARGTAARNALTMIDTGPTQTLPGQGVFLGWELLPDGSVKLSLDAARATNFKLLHKGPDDADFAVLAENLTEKTFTHLALALGGHTYKVVGINSAGAGVESLPFIITVVQQAAAA